MQSSEIQCIMWINLPHRIRTLLYTATVNINLVTVHKCYKVEVFFFWRGVN